MIGVRKSGSKEVIVIMRRTVLPVQSPSGLPIELVSSILRMCGGKDRLEIRLRKKEACCCGDQADDQALDGCDDRPTVNL